MKSLILTVLYLIKDTVHRWVTRLSSPVARILVVFFLTLCALCFLGTYVISAKLLQDRIRSQGGDLVHLVIGDQQGKRSFLPLPGELEELLGADSVALRALGYVRTQDGASLNVCTYDFPRMGQVLPHMAPSGMPTILTGEHSSLHPGPAQVEFQGKSIDVFVRRLPADVLLGKLLSKGDTLVVQPDSYLAQEVMKRSPQSMQNLLLRVRDTSSSEGVRRALEYCENYLKLEKGYGYVNSALPLLREMDVILSNQVQCRMAFCLGIAIIVGILLTALAGMEYRQNEYIYTLMKSFGIHPLLLVGAFIAENLVLVGASFAGAVWVFMHFQRFMVQQFFKTGNYTLVLGEIMPELQLIAVSLLVCVLVSAIPIIFAANRDIGRVLK